MAEDKTNADIHTPADRELDDSMKQERGSATDHKDITQPGPSISQKIATIKHNMTHDNETESDPLLPAVEIMEKWKHERKDGSVEENMMLGKNIDKIGNICNSSNTSNIGNAQTAIDRKDVNHSGSNSGQITAPIEQSMIPENKTENDSLPSAFRLRKESKHERTNQTRKDGPAKENMIFGITNDISDFGGVRNIGNINNTQNIGNTANKHTTKIRENSNRNRPEEHRSFFYRGRGGT